MSQYKVKGNEGFDTFLEIVKEKSDGYDVRITCVYEDYKKETEEFINKRLFETCIRTGYLQRTDRLEHIGAGL
jgi:hypothetical protein